MCSYRIDQAYAQYCAARVELLDAITEVSASEEWRGDGAADLASWLAARWQISAHTGRRLVREAEALDAHPVLRDALGSGAISIDQSKALTILCREESDDDELWLEVLPFWTLPELEREARKQVARELEKRDDGVYFRTRHTADERYLRGEFQLRPEDGAAVLAAIDARVAPDTRLREWDRASALALVELAKGGGHASARSTVLLSVSDDVLDGAGDIASLGSGGFVDGETARRFMCDARVQVLYRDETDSVTGVGRASRTISPPLRAAVTERDRGMCVFPGCERDAYLECHHVVPFGRGGPTILSNLVLVCWRHHRLVHEDGWSLRGEAGPKISWIRPDGSLFEPRVRVVLDTS